MNPIDLYSSWAEIDLGAVQNNIHYIRENTGVQVMAIVKANAYGHGATAVAMAAVSAGASWCGVARVEEALELRQAGMDCPILLLGYTPPKRFEEVITQRVSLTVWDASQVQAAAEAAARANLPACLHIKVDTGMSRVGIQPQEALDFARSIASNGNLKLEGIFTHFARADESNPATTDGQEKTFHEVLAALEQHKLLPPVVHASNSAAIISRPSAHFTLLRAGVAMYGLHPSRQRQLPAAFRPALSWKSVLSQVKTLPPGRGVSYGHIYVTQKAERIGTIAIGYADGFRRTSGNRVLVCGKSAPIVGRVCMDQVMVQLDGIPDAKAGDEVIIIGRQEEALITAEDVADTWGTINYEVTSGIGPRVPRVYK